MPCMSGDAITLPHRLRLRCFSIKEKVFSVTCTTFKFPVVVLHQEKLESLCLG